MKVCVIKGTIYKRGKLYDCVFVCVCQLQLCSKNMLCNLRLNIYNIIMI